MIATEILRKYYGYDNFRDGQESLVNGIIMGKDVLGIMPTGAGKSICFQVPALMMDGITLVVSPLISLMKDQVNALTQAGVAAAFINSSLTERQIAKALYNADNGVYKLIYVAPERLLTYEFMQFATKAEIAMVAVDEAHCISQWGQDFRPSYTEIPKFITRLKKRPVISAFTATATNMVRQDIKERLGLDDPIVLVAGFDRKNLRFDVKRPGGKKFEALLAFLQDKKDRYGIVYCSTRAKVENVCEKLRQYGYNSSRYHAGLTDDERRTNQDDFLHDRTKVMVATNAFGMGIDKSNVSFVVHYNMPKDIEGYYQEAGRAGRDGGVAECLLLYGGNDFNTNMWFIEETERMAEHLEAGIVSEIKERNIERLYKMDEYCKTNDCLRGYILNYFGEAPPENCGNCCNCEAEHMIIDITVEAQMIVSCVTRMKERFGAKMVAEVLVGSKSSRLIGFGLDKLPTYGISDKTVAELEEIINYMIFNGYLHKTADRFPLLKLGERTSEVLKKDARIMMKSVGNKAGSVKSIARLRNPVAVNAILFTALKERRLEVAKEQGVPAYVVFHDSTLTDMCMKLPTSIEEIMEISGVGVMKAEKYGRRFLEVIEKFLDSSTESRENPAVFVEFDSEKIEISDEAVSVNGVADRINCLLLECGYAKITGKKINDWLVAQGYLIVLTEGAKTKKVPSEKGTEIGITAELRTIRGEDVLINQFDRNAQKLIINNVKEIIGK